MGWTDREPYFSMIENITDEIVDEEGLPRDKAWEHATERVSDMLLEAADQMRKGE